MSSPVYVARRPARSLFVTVRGLRYHLLAWGDPALATPDRPPLVLLHGWMDVAASFQFMVDALAGERYVVAADWRGWARSRCSAATAASSGACSTGTRTRSASTRRWAPR